MALVLDSGALIALEKNDRAMWRRFKEALLSGEVPVTHGGVVGQAWRGGAKQASLARALAAIDVRPLDDALGRAAGLLLADARRSDVIDAAIVLLAEDHDRIVTSDPRDIERLAAFAGRHVELVLA
jgi:predicted nucleic acid-binding protein